jgi:hypothetical protein
LRANCTSVQNLDSRSSPGSRTATTRCDRAWIHWLTRRSSPNRGPRRSP